MISENDASILGEFEELRGVTIEVVSHGFVAGFQEQSDSKLLCGNPLVSVLMITYNHERYIRQAIEGIVTQDCDFDFELIIGEDCSDDKTREICFEYQKKYPSIVRVLYSANNIGVCYNSKRVREAVRGQFVAYCEGDDRWCDVKKLRKQVDVLQRNSSVGLVFSNVFVCDQYDNMTKQESVFGGLGDQIITGRDFGDNVLGGRSKPFFMLSAMWRWSMFTEAVSHLRIFEWDLPLCDVQSFLAIAVSNDLYIIDDYLVVRNENLGSLMHTIPYKIYRDGALVRLYFARKMYGSIDKAPETLKMLLLRRCEVTFDKSYRNRLQELRSISKAFSKYHLRFDARIFLLMLFLALGFGRRGIKLAALIACKLRLWH